MFNEDLAAKCCKLGTVACPAFDEGQEFVVDLKIWAAGGQDGLKQPENFCSWAWNDLHKGFLALYSAGRFTPLYEGGRGTDLVLHWTGLKGNT